jgi:hypothetical protein
METNEWRSYVKEAEVFYKLSEELKFTHPLIAYFANLHGLKKVAKNMHNKIPKKVKNKVLKVNRNNL